MAQLIVRNLDPAIVAKLRRQAAAHGRSMEAEHREILREVLTTGRRRASLKDHLREIPEVGTDEDFVRVQDKGRRSAL